MGVSMMPGRTQLTRMPRAAWAEREERVSDSTPAFAAAYTATSGMAPVLAAVDETVTMDAVIGQPMRERLEQEEHRAAGWTP